jgi:hypothetical protein
LATIRGDARRGDREGDMLDLLIQRTIFPIKNAITTDDTVATIPGIMKLWFRMYLPIRVVPVWSKEIAASKVA